MQKSTKKKEIKTEEIINVEVEEEGPRLDITLTTEGMLDIGGRWTIDPTTKFALCLSEEFEQAIMSYTHHNQDEWGGFIVGHDIDWINPENQRVVKIMICERAVVLGQTRSGASYEILEEVVSEWMNSDDKESDMAFLTVFAVNRWKKIGWVHSHADMGVFWSGTDKNTMKDMRSVPTLVSIVYSRNGKGLNRRIRIDRNATWFGGKYNLFMDEVADNYVHSETPIEKLDDVPKKIQEKYKKILKDTRIIHTTSHHQQSVTKTKSVTKYGTHYQHAYGDYEYDGRFDGGFRGFVRNQYGHYVQPTRQTTLTGEPVVKKQTTSTKKEKKRSLTIFDFFRFLGAFDHLLKDDEGNFKTGSYKMKEVVGKMSHDDASLAIKRLSEIPDTLEMLYLDYQNYKAIWLNFFKNLKKRVEDDKKLNKRIEKEYGKDWLADALDIVDKAIESAKIRRAEFIEKVEAEAEAEKEKEEKVLPFVPDKKIYDWKEWFMALPDKYKNMFIENLFFSVDDDLSIKILDKIEDAFTYQVRSEEIKRAGEFGALYDNMLVDYEKVSNKWKETYKYLYSTFFRTALYPYFESYSDKEKKLQSILNAIDKENVKAFINDFIVQYETEEELKELVEKQKIPVYMRTYICPHCEVEHPTEEGMEKCIEECKKRAIDRATEATEVEAQAAKKASVPTSGAINKTTTSGTTTTTSSDKIDYLYGTPIDFFKKENVCKYCGLIYDTEEAAKLCEEECLDFLSDLKEAEIKDSGEYRCPLCRQAFTNLDIAETHDDDCPEYGAVYVYVLFGGERHVLEKKSTVKDVLKQILKYYLLKPDTTLPDFYVWVRERLKDDKRPLDSCEKCGEHITHKKPVENVILTYMHEKYCVLEDKKAVIDYSNGWWSCRMCGLYRSNQINYIMKHILDEHGMYLTASDLEVVREAAKSKPKKDNVIITTEHICYDGLYQCRMCGDSNLRFITFDRVMSHLITQHRVDPFQMIDEIMFYTTKNGTDESESDVGFFRTKNVLLFQGTMKCKHCEFSTALTEVMIKHLRKEHGIEINVDEHNLWMQHELDYWEPKLRPKTTSMLDVVTDNASLYNGVIECNHCHMIMATAPLMMEHITKEHSQHSVKLAEYNVWTDYFNDFEESALEETESVKADLPEEYHDLFDNWLLSKAQSVEDSARCSLCGLEFVEWMDPVQNAMDCFLHEIECDGERITDLFTCMYCGEPFKDDEELDEHEFECESRIDWDELDELWDLDKQLYVCKFCGGKFVHKADRDEHESEYCVNNKSVTEKWLDEEDEDSGTN